MPQPGSAAALVLLALACTVPSVAQDQAIVSPLFGKPVGTIEFEPAEQPVSREQMLLSIRIAPGETLTEDALIGSISRLYATGHFLTIVVDGKEADGKANLTFVTTRAFFTSRVTVVGVKEPPNSAQLVGAAGLRLGDAFDDDLLPEAAEQIKRLLYKNGFEGADVRYDTSSDGQTSEMNIRFTIEPGNRARYGLPEFRGNLQATPQKLVRVSDWQRRFFFRWFGPDWHYATQSKTNEGIDNLRKWYSKKDYLTATVRLTEIEFLSGVTAIPKVDIEAGPRTAVRVEGVKLSKRDLRELVPVYQEGSVDAELIREGQTNIQTHLRSRGYFNAVVNPADQRRTKDGEMVIQYDVAPGTRFRLAEVTIEGNKYFPHKELNDLLTIIPARFPRYKNGVYSEELLEQNLQAIRNRYLASGFRDVKVESKRILDWKGKARDMAVQINIVEGPQWKVGKLDVTGVDLQLVDRIQELISSQPGQPFSPAAIVEDRDSVLNYYFNNGFLQASVDPTVEDVEGQRLVNIRYAVTEGRRTFVRDVLIRGLEITRPSLVENRLLVKAKEPLSQAKIVQTQQRLYDLGIFASVDAGVQNPDGREREKYVIFQMEEARKYSLNLGFGAQLGIIGSGTNNLNTPAGTAGFSPRFLIGINRLNAFGLGQTASATFRVSNIQQRLLFNYFAPHIRNRDNLDVTFSTLFERSADINTYVSTRAESGLQLSQQLKRSLSAQYRYSYRYVYIDPESLKISPILIPVYSQPDRTATVAGALVQDRRDNPIDSTKGYYNTIDGGYAAPALGSGTHFTRFVVGNSTYTSLSKEVVFARRTSFGWLYNLRNTPVPLPEHFFGGGANTNRAFPENQAGPRDLQTGFPLGGDAFLFFNSEIRFPLFGKSVGGVLFHDMGNVYTNAARISFRYKQKDLADFDYMVQAVGFGIRYKTPVGPLRLDLSYGPNSPKFYGFDGTYDQLISPDWKNYRSIQRINQFQFHFSIGQTF